MSKFTLVIKQRAWDIAKAKPTTIRHLATVLGLTEFNVENMIRAMINDGYLAKLPNGTLRVTELRPEKASGKPKIAALDATPKPNGTTKLRVPNSIWQWGAFV